MWTVIAIVLMILGPAILLTYFIVDGYEAWKLVQEKLAIKRVEREAAERAEACRREQLERMLREQERLNHEARVRMETEARARYAAANQPVPTWCLGVARMSATGSKLPNLYYKLPTDFKPEWIDEIMKAYQDAENAHLDVVVLPHIAITVRTKTAIRIRIRQADMKPGQDIPKFLI